MSTSATDNVSAKLTLFLTWLPLGDFSTSIRLILVTKLVLTIVDSYSAEIIAIKLK